MNTQRTYKVLPANQIQAGDFIKITRIRVEAVEVEGENTRLTYANGRTGTIRSTERHGIYRKVA